MIDLRKSFGDPLTLALIAVLAGALLARCTAATHHPAPRRAPSTIDEDTKPRRMQAREDTGRLDRLPAEGGMGVFCYAV